MLCPLAVTSRGPGAAAVLPMYCDTPTLNSGLSHLQKVNLHKISRRISQKENQATGTTRDLTLILLEVGVKQIYLPLWQTFTLGSLHAACDLVSNCSIITHDKIMSCLWPDLGFETIVCRGAQICTLIPANLESQIPSLIVKHGLPVFSHD